MTWVNCWMLRFDVAERLPVDSAATGRSVPRPTGAAGPATGRPSQTTCAIDGFGRDIENRADRHYYGDAL